MNTHDKIKKQTDKINNILQNFCFIINIHPRPEANIKINIHNNIKKKRSIKSITLKNYKKVYNLFIHCSFLSVA